MKHRVTLSTFTISDVIVFKLLIRPIVNCGIIFSVYLFIYCRLVHQTNLLCTRRGNQNHGTIFLLLLLFHKRGRVEVNSQTSVSIFRSGIELMISCEYWSDKSIRYWTTPNCLVMVSKSCHNYFGDQGKWKISHPQFNLVLRNWTDDFRFTAPSIASELHTGEVPVLCSLSVCKQFLTFSRSADALYES